MTAAILPDLNGFVHGIKGIDPWVIQCDGCGRFATGPSRTPNGAQTNLVVLTCGIQFGHADTRRLCGRCRVDAGWEDFDTCQLRARPTDLAQLEAIMLDQLPLSEIVLPAEAAGLSLSTYWAARALQDPALCDEDREMAEAAYARAMDVQMGTVGKGTFKGLREIFPIGAEVRAEREAKRAREDEERRETAEQLIEDDAASGVLFRMEEFA